MAKKSSSSDAVVAPMVAIIGTSTSGNEWMLATENLPEESEGVWKCELYRLMVEKSAALIEGRFGMKLCSVHLVSGGAAWSDHVAVTLFLEDRVAGLTLYLPCPLMTGEPPSFASNGSRSWKTNPGWLANDRHQSFSVEIGRHTLREIEAARLKGARIVTDYSGFHARNSAIAKNAERLIAFTWGADVAPAAGGTLDTWKKARCEKVHVSLGELVLGPVERKKVECDCSFFH